MSFDLLQNHQSPSGDDYQLTGYQLPTHRLTDRWHIHNFSVHRLTDHRLINLLTLLQLTDNPFTHRTYFSRVIIGPIVLLTKYKWSFTLCSIYYWIRKITHKIIGKKNFDKLQILLIIPFGNCYLTIVI